MLGVANGFAFSIRIDAALLSRSRFREPEVGEVVCGRVRLKRDGIGLEWLARQPWLFEPVLAFFDLLFRFATLIVERHQAVLAAHTDRRPLTGQNRLSASPTIIVNNWPIQESAY